MSNSLKKPLHPRQLSETLQATSLRGLLQSFQRRQQFLILRLLVQRIHFGKCDFAVFIHDEYCPLADSWKRRPLTQNAECSRDRGMGIDVRTHGEMHLADCMLLPSHMAVNRVDADIQELSIERGELLAVRVECRQLFAAGRRPIQRMKGHDHILLPAKITELDV